MRTLFRPFAGLLAATIVYLTPTLTFFAALGDRALTIGLRFLDSAFPVAAMAGHPAHPLVATREVTYLTTGLHRLAQKRCCLGDPEDDDEDDDAISNVLGRSPRLNC